MKAFYLSQTQYDKLNEELMQLKRVDRPKVIEEIAEARAHGDLKENAEYDAAKEKQSLVERKIGRLEEMLSRARILNEDEISENRVVVGRKVKLIDTNTKEEMVYELVPSAEFNSMNVDAISVDSPVGKALVGKEIGDLVEIKVPSGILKYKVEQVIV